MKIENLEIYNETKSISDKDMLLLSSKFLKIKNKILGDDFFLSVSFLNSKNAVKINKKQRGQKYVPNTLSFKYGLSSGEIVMTPEIIEKENYENVPKKTENKIIYLFIHSCLHLLDLDHGKKMDTLEKKYLKKFIK